MQPGAMVASDLRNRTQGVDRTTNRRASRGDNGQTWTFRNREKVQFVLKSIQPKTSTGIDGNPPQCIGVQTHHPAGLGQGHMRIVACQNDSFRDCIQPKRMSRCDQSSEIAQGAATGSDASRSHREVEAGRKPFTELALQLRKAR